MSYSDSFPTQRPSLNLDFANSGKLDSRLSYSRSSTGTAFSSERHLSSENTQTNSDSLGSLGGVFVATLSSGGQVGPDGSTTNASLLTGSAGTALKGFWFAAGGFLQTVSFFAKEGTHRFIQLSVEGDSTKYVNFDLNSSGAVSANGSGVTASITASGNGFLRCAVNLTVPSAGNVYITLQDSISVAREASTASTGTVSFHGLQTTTLGDATNVAAYVATTSQIHREFAPTLKTAAADTPRFEYATDGQSVGTALGLLVESQASNLATYGSDLTNAIWNPLSATAATAAIGPDGTLSAAKLTSGTGSGLYPRFRRLSFLSTSKTQTFSVYVKPLEYSYLNISQDGHSTQMVHYNLTGSGSISSSAGCSGTVEQCGNGWFRVSFTHTNATSSVNLAIVMQSTATYSSETGNSYDGMLFASAQLEDAATASSFISTSSSQVSRASDSCSVATSSFYTGGPVTIVGEVSGGNGTAALADLRDEDATLASYLLIWKASAANTDASNFKVYSKDSGYLQVNKTVTGSGGATTIAVRLDTNNFAACADGGTLTTDTSSVVLPSGLSKLWIASAMSGYQLDSTIKNLRFYNVALSDTELQAITS